MNNQRMNNQPSFQSAPLGYIYSRQLNSRYLKQLHFLGDHSVSLGRAANANATLNATANANANANAKPKGPLAAKGKAECPPASGEKPGVSAKGGMFGGNPKLWRLKL
jgi:hypothetical protein